MGALLGFFLILGFICADCVEILLHRYGKHGPWPHAPRFTETTRRAATTLNIYILYSHFPATLIASSLHT